MKVILSEDVRNLGKSGDVVKVADGYGRNFLIPRRLAMAATENSIKEAKHLKSVSDAKKKKSAVQAKAIAEKISGFTVTIKAPAGENDKLFGSVTTSDIANELAKLGMVVDRREVVIEEPIKVLGQYRVKVKVATGVEAEVKVNVERGSTT